MTDKLNCLDPWTQNKIINTLHSYGVLYPWFLEASVIAIVPDSIVIGLAKAVDELMSRHVSAADFVTKSNKRLGLNERKGYWLSVAGGTLYNQKYPRHGKPVRIKM